MLGQPVMVKPAEAEKNMAWEAQQAAKQSNAAEAELAALGLGPLGAAAPPPGLLQLCDGRPTCGVVSGCVQHCSCACML
jgi:hypothetical protein